MNPAQLQFIAPQDRIPLLLALSLYDEHPREISPFLLLKNNKRAASWTDGKTQIIGIRGSYIGGLYSNLDEQDDIQLATSAHCDLSIIPFAEQLTTSLPTIYVGHSLGGSAAHCLTQKYPHSRGTGPPPVMNLTPTRYWAAARHSQIGIGYNSGAPPTNPVLVKSTRFVNYHIVGDLISCHMIGSTRILIDGVGFGGSKAHEVERLKDTGVVVTATEEDEMYRDWSRRAVSVPDNILFVPKLEEQVWIRKLGETAPIPGSDRAIMYGI